jgi:hypothetical protein
MSNEIEFQEWVEIKLRVYATYQPAEREERTYPGCPASIEIDQIKIETKGGERILTLDGLKDYIMVEEGESLVQTAWEHKE